MSPCHHIPATLSHCSLGGNPSTHRRHSSLPWCGGFCKALLIASNYGGLLFDWSPWWLMLQKRISSILGARIERWRVKMFKKLFVSKISICVGAIFTTDIDSFASGIFFTVLFSSVQSVSRVWLFATPWIAACQASLSITNSWRSLKLMSIESVMASSHLILCRPLFLLPPIPPSIRVFSNESTLHMRWPKYWSFSCSIIPSKEHPGLISFRMDWLDLLAVQGILKNVLKHHSSKA